MNEEKTQIDRASSEVNVDQRVIKFFAWEGSWIKIFFFYNAIFWVISSMIIKFSDSNDEKWFSRVFLGLICYGFYAIFKAIESKKSL